MNDVDGAVLEGEYVEPVSLAELYQRAAACLMVMSLALEALEARGRLPAATRALRLAVPRLDWDALLGEASAE
jgi:hypothetical protein